MPVQWCLIIFKDVKNDSNNHYCHIKCWFLRIIYWRVCLHAAMYEMESERSCFLAYFVYAFKQQKKTCLTFTKFDQNVHCWAYKNKCTHISNVFVLDLWAYIKLNSGHKPEFKMANSQFLSSIWIGSRVHLSNSNARFWSVYQNVSSGVWNISHDSKMALLKQILTYNFHSHMAWKKVREKKKAWTDNLR